jgi:YhcH/YjgK/YiaL family protein
MTQHTNEKAEHWFRSNIWKDGLQLDADPVTNIESFYKQYHANKSGWNQAFAFLKLRDLDNIAPGRHEIDGDNVYAAVSEAPNMEYDKTSWESHRRYIDIQYVIRGKEQIGITTFEGLKVSQEYNEEKDVIFYTGEGPIHSFQPGTFFVFFPEDVHRPGIKGATHETVKKIVLKIKVAG